MTEKRILVVDDEPEMRWLIRIGLDKANGYQVIEAASGQEALEKAGLYHPDLILMDIGMPGMTGLEACRQLKSTPLGRDIPVIFVSAWSSNEYRQAAEEAGGADFMPKPFSVKRLLQLVAQYV